ATVTGSVNPGGQSTSWYVEYGTSTSYGSKTATSGARAAERRASISADLSGLQAGTTYHYRVVATNNTGTSHGSDAVFTTLTPPVATTSSATSISASSATLNGTVDPNSRDTSYYFEYGTSTSYGTKTAVKSAGPASSPQSESVSINGLQAGHTYHFRIVATSDAGTSTGNDASFTTSAAPGVETGDVASVTTTTATLRGNVNPNGLSTTWWFEYGTSTNYSSRTSSHSAGSGTATKGESIGIKSLRPATTYHYRIVAQNSSGRSYGADRTFATVGAPSTATGAAQNVGPETALLTGSLDTHGRSTTWWFQYGTSTGYGTSTPAKSAGSKAGAQTVTWQLSGLQPGATYHYRLVAKSDGGTAYGADAAFATQGVTLTVVARQVVFGGRIKLAGIVPTHNAGEQIAVYAQPYGGGSFHLVTTVLSGVGGTWAYIAQPGIATAYEAMWHGASSQPISIGVHPRIGFSRARNGKFLVRASGAHAFPHRIVQVQRRSEGRWRTIRRVRLGARSRAQFAVSLPRGTSTLRIAMSVNQAGAGFL